MTQLLPKVRDKWYKWEADTDFVAPDGYYLKSENMDTFSNPKYVKLSPKPVLLYDKTADFHWDGVLTIFSKYWKIINIWTDSGWWDAYIYNNWVYATSIHNVATMYKAIEFQNLIFFVYLRKWYEFASPVTVHYGFITIDETSGNITSVFNPVEWRVEQFWTYNIELYNFNDALLVFACWYKVRSVKWALLIPSVWWIYPCDTVTPTLQLRRRDNVVGIVQFMEQFKIYTVYGNRDTPQTSCVYICNQADIENGKFTNKIDYPALNIRAVISNWSVDYGICSDWDYLFSWSQKPTKVTSSPSYTDFRRANTTYWWSSYVTTFIDGDYNVRIYGTWIAWFPNQMSCLIEFSQIYSMTAWLDKIIVSWVYNWVKWVFLVSDDRDDVLEKVDTWNLTFIKFYGNVMWTIKKVEQFTMWHKIPLWTEIDVQISINDWAFTTIKTFSWASYVNEVRSFIYWNDIASSTLEFSWIQLKIVLRSSSSNRVLTPWVSDLFMLYTDAIRWR